MTIMTVNIFSSKWMMELDVFGESLQVVSI